MKIEDLKNLFEKQRNGRTDWYRIENKGNNKAEVFIYDEIGFWGITANDFVRDLKALDVTEIDLRLNSPGGEFYDGLAIYTQIKSHPANVTVYVDSIAASAASFIAMAGDEVVMMKHSELMIHDAMTLAIGNAEELEATVKRLNTISDNIAGIYADRAGGTPEDWRALMREETWFSDQEAVNAKLADRVDKNSAADDDDDLDIANRRELCIVNFKHPGRKEAPEPKINIAPIENTACPSHGTATKEGTWSRSAQEKKLPTPVPLAKAKKFYGSYDQDAVEDGAIPKSAGHLPHHEVSSDGTPGAAIINGVRNALARLNQVSGMGPDEEAAVRRHLNKHLKDHGIDPDTDDVLHEDEDETTGEISFDFVDELDFTSLFKEAINEAGTEIRDYDPQDVKDAITAFTHTAPAETVKVPEKKELPEPIELTKPEPDETIDNSDAAVVRDILTAVANDAPAVPVRKAEEVDKETFDLSFFRDELRKVVRG